MVNTSIVELFACPVTAAGQREGMTHKLRFQLANPVIAAGGLACPNTGVHKDRLRYEEESHHVHSHEE